MLKIKYHVCKLQLTHAVFANTQSRVFKLLEDYLLAIIDINALSNWFARQLDAVEVIPVFCIVGNQELYILYCSR